MQLFLGPIEFLCILLLEERFVQVQALQQRVPGLSLSQYEYEIFINNQAHHSQSVIVVHVWKIHLGYLLKT